MNLSSMKYFDMRKHQNNDFKRCQDFEDTGKIRCLCQNGSRHKNDLTGQVFKTAKMPYRVQKTVSESKVCEK